MITLAKKAHLEGLSLKFSSKKGKSAMAVETLADRLKLFEGF